MMSSSVEKLQYHLVFVTKYRYNLLTEEMAKCLRNYFLKQQEKLNYTILSLAIERNHVHILFSVSSSVLDLNTIIQKIKGGSSFLIRKKFKHLTRYSSLWTPSHFLGTVGDVSASTVRSYIDAQGIEEKETVTRSFVYKVLCPTIKKKNILDRYIAECTVKKRTTVPASIFQDFSFHKVESGSLYLRAQNNRLEKASRAKSADYWLKVSGGKGSPSFWIGLLGRELPADGKVKDAVLSFKKGDFYLRVPVEQDRHIRRICSSNIMSIDLGFNHPIASVTVRNGRMKEEQFFGKEIKDLATKRARRYSQLQKSGAETPNVLRWTRRIDAYLHGYVNNIVERAKEIGASIVVGDLSLSKKLRKGKSNKSLRQKGGRVPYFRIKTYLHYKALLSGVPIVFVDEAYTSQTCSRCGVVLKENRKGERYECKNCGYKQQADLNGAINIAAKGKNLLEDGETVLWEEAFPPLCSGNSVEQKSECSIGERA
jgi:IS605 OrfB family transposase